MVSPGPSVRSKKRGRKTKHNQPADIREGVSNAIMLVKEVGFFTVTFLASLSFFFLNPIIALTIFSVIIVAS